MLAHRLRAVKRAQGPAERRGNEAVDRSAGGTNDMVDDPTKLHADGRRINVSQEHECRYWAEKFGVSPGELKVAVSKAGPMVEDVARALGKSDDRR
jgi:hypothetical protein